MKSWVLAAGLLAAAATTSAAWAADLDEGPPPDRYGAYEDPRYADVYRHPQPPAYPPPAGPRYGGPNTPPGYVYRDNEDGYGEEYDDRGRYAYAPRPHYRPGCAPREVIQERLLSQGWRDFRDAEERGEFATIIARRPNGRPFALTLERCSGEIVNVRPLDDGHFAYGPPPRRWDRPY
jgi:hypothetical protein